MAKPIRNKKRQWFKAQAAANDGIAKITIDGVIGSSWFEAGVASVDFMNAVNALGDVTEIHIDMNSPGGAVSDGLTIANFLRNHAARVVVNVLGQASSIASVMASAADEVRMGLGAFMFVHKASSCLCGNADQMAAAAQDLATIDAGILDVYVARVGDDNRAEMEDLIKGPDGNGTLLSAEKAKELGLADSITEVKAAASVADLMDGLRQMRADAEAMAEQEDDEAESSDPLTAAQALAVAFDIEPEEAEAQAEDLAEQILALRQGTATNEIVAEGLTVGRLRAEFPDLVTQIETAVDSAPAAEAAVTGERNRIVDIVQACATTGSYTDLEKLITEEWEASKAKDYIIGLAAAADASINGNLSPDAGQPTAINSSTIYGRRKSKARN